MKPVKLLLLAVGVVLALVLTAGGLAFVPAVQRWAVLRVLRAQPGLKFEVAVVAADLTHFRLDGVRVEKNGVTVLLEHVEADYSSWQLLFSRRLVLGQLTGRGLMVDARKVSSHRAGAAAAGVSVGAPGLLSQIELPVGIVLGDCLVEGRALLPGSAGGSPVEATGRITGGKFAPGQEGALVLAMTLKNPAPLARVTTFRAELSLRVQQTEQRSFSRVLVTAVVDAEGKNLSGQEQLKVTAELAKTVAGENYALNVDTLIHGAAEKALVLRATLPIGGKEYSGTWQLLVRAAQLEPFLLGAVLPESEAHGEGHFTFNPTTMAASLHGELNAEVSHLEQWESSWRAIGPVKLSTQFDGGLADGIARINQLHLALSGEQPVLELSVTQAVEYNLRTHRLEVGGAIPAGAVTLDLRGLPLAWVRPFVRTVDVTGGLITGQLAISGQTDGLLLHAAQPLRIGQLNVVQAGQQLLGKGDLELDFDAVLSKTGLLATLNRFSLSTPSGDTLTAKAKANMSFGAGQSIAVAAEYTADLPTLLAPWLPLGRIGATGEADFTLTGRNLEVRRLESRVTDAAGLELFRATTLRPFTIDQTAHRVVVTGSAGGGELLRVAVGRLPLAVLRLGVPGTKLGGFVMVGELVAAMKGEKLTVRAPTALKLGDVSLSAQGRPVLLGLSIEAQPEFELSSPGGTSFESGPITVRDANGVVLATLKAEATQTGKDGLKGSATFMLDVPSLATQPIFAGAKTVLAGRASGEVRVAFGVTRQLEARMTVNGLVASADNAVLPVANLSVRAVAQPDGKMSVEAPLLLDRAGVRSDLGMTLNLTPAGRGYMVEGKLAGEQVELADALAVLGIFLPPATGVPPPVETPVLVQPAAVGTVPAWSRFTGRLALDVKSVARGTDWAMSGLTGTVVIEPADITLQNLAARFGEKGHFTAKALLSFTKGAQPYDLAGDFSLTDFDVGKLFKALEPARPATVEGMFSVAGSFTGNGETLGRIFERTHGSILLTSRQGVFRGLQRTTNKVSLASKAVDLVGSLFGGSKVVEKVAGAAYYVDQLAQTLGEFNYDQLNLKLVRDPALNVTLEDISLIAPEIRLLGSGTITYVAGKPLLEQPLSVTLSLAGRGKPEGQLGRLHLLSGERDELGYARIRENLTLGGTLARPDPTAFFTRLATGKLTELLAPGN